MGTLIKKGSRGEDVKQLQENLKRLGYDLSSDGIFGDATEDAVRQLQKSFGYNVDGMVGDATQKLISQQMGLNWSAKNAAANASNMGKNTGPMPGKQ